jgi:uncharacterized protein YdeI (YjbR/CyaY-like superfamily)
MTDMKHPEVDAFIRGLTRWKEELTALREIVLSCGLKEEWKWRQPCYTDDGVNIVILGNYKDACVISFLKGAMLKDPEGLLHKPGEHTRMGRVIRFTGIAEILERREILKAYVLEAVQIEKQDVKPAVEASPEIEIPEELDRIFGSDAAFRQAFGSLTPGRQRAYLIFFTATKQSATRVARIEKYRSRIMTGKGMNDCVCGLSKKMPGCDGSHRLLKA